MDVDRLDRICAHVEEHGIADVIPFLTTEEFAHIEASGAFRRFFQKKQAADPGGPDAKLPPMPHVRGLGHKFSVGEQHQIHTVQRRYLAEMAPIVAARRRAGPRDAAKYNNQLQHIREQYLLEMKHILREMAKAHSRRSIEKDKRKYAVPADLPPPPSYNAMAAAIEAQFDFWMACL
jgi:hypothetical protein